MLLIDIDSLSIPAYSRFLNPLDPWLLHYTLTAAQARVQVEMPAAAARQQSLTESENGSEQRVRSKAARRVVRKDNTPQLGADYVSTLLLHPRI